MRNTTETCNLYFSPRHYGVIYSRNIILTVACLTGLSGCSTSKFPAPFDAKVIRVHDGDTLTIARVADSTNVRLSKIDAPELKQKFGEKSRDRLSELCMDKTVHVVTSSIDRDGRLVASVQIGSKTLNEQLVCEGLAWWYKEFDSNDPVMEKLQEKARAQQLGIWQQAEPQPPWEFRKKRREQIAFSKSLNKSVWAVAFATGLLIVGAVSFRIINRRARANVQKKQGNS